MKSGKLLLPALICFVTACTKDHRAPTAENNVEGTVVGLLGCTSGIRAGSKTFLVGNLNSFPAYNPQQGAKVFFSYKDRKDNVSNICNIEASSITLTALRNR